MTTLDLDRITAACGILIGVGADGSFAHVGTAWAAGPGEWVTAWAGEDPPPASLRLLHASDGCVGELSGWECDAGIAGFTSLTSSEQLTVATDQTLHKRDRLWGMGYPSLIDHPAFRLHHGSLDAERYFPYVCPWTIAGHLGLFSADDGYLTGRFYDGMGGGPVINASGQVVGLLLDGDVSPEHPALTRFRRFA